MQADLVVLLIQLNRFSFANGSPRKLDNMVDFPLEVSFHLKTYRLVASICHIGSCCSGHYTSFTLHGNQWFSMNDDNVTPVNSSSVFNKDTYLLLYRSVSNFQT